MPLATGGAAHRNCSKPCAASSVKSVPRPTWTIRTSSALSTMWAAIGWRPGFGGHLRDDHAHDEPEGTDRHVPLRVAPAFPGSGLQSRRAGRGRFGDGFGRNEAALLAAQVALLGRVCEVRLLAEPAMKSNQLPHE